ncbi:MAG: O-antigen ligase family protein [bacterium]
MKSFLKWALLLTGFMPLVYSSGSLFPYIFPKGLYFRGLIFVAVVVFCITCAAKKNFRDEMIAKISSVWKNSVFKWMTFFYGALLLSTIFAFDRYMALFGNIEREEGFVGLFFFYIFFVLITILFEKKDWLRFFVVNMLAGLVLFLVEASQFFLQNNARPGSLTDNPIFLATYLIFVIFSAVMVYRAANKKNNTLVMSASMVSIIISLVGIFMTQTRGALLGMFFGLIVVFIYFGIASKNIIVYKNISLRRLVVYCMVVGAVFVAIFVSTRHSSVWAHIPGLNRVALISTNDPTTQARFVNAGIAVHAVDPREVGITRSFFGWGWDNYIYAWQKFYNPRLFSFDQSLFDRAHDKLLDVLLMSGILGIITYLGLWFVFFREAFKKGKEFSLEIAMFVFWGIAFFLQNLTVFDTLVTFITFYAIFAYLIYETRENTNTTITK